jgi:hypothetical protein
MTEKRSNKYEIAFPQRETLHETGGSFHPQFCRAAILRFAYQPCQTVVNSWNVMRNYFSRKMIYNEVIEKKAEMENNIFINRSSVCAGDDIEDHKINIETSKEITFSELFNKLIKENYFPGIVGNNVVWTLLYDNDDIVSWITKENKLFHHFIGDEPTIYSYGENIERSIFFQYYTSPLIRAEYIFKKFNGKHFHIMRDGFIKEYEYYKISNEIEKEWLKTI